MAGNPKQWACVFILNLLVGFFNTFFNETPGEGQENMIFDVVSSGLFLCGV